MNNQNSMFATQTNSTPKAMAKENLVLDEQ